MKSGITRNPLKNPRVMRRLNPYANVLKKYAKITNSRRQEAKLLLKKKRAGEKLSPEEVKKVERTLNVKVRPMKEFVKEQKSKAAAAKAAAEKVAAARLKKAAAKKAKATASAKTSKKK